MNERQKKLIFKNLIVTSLSFIFLNIIMYYIWTSETVSNRISEFDFIMLLDNNILDIQNPSIYNLITFYSSGIFGDWGYSIVSGDKISIEFFDTGFMVLIISIVLSPLISALIAYNDHYISESYKKFLKSKFFIIIFGIIIPLYIFQNFKEEIFINNLKNFFSFPVIFEIMWLTIFSTSLITHSYFNLCDHFEFQADTSTYPQPELDKTSGTSNRGDKIPLFIITYRNMWKFIFGFWLILSPILITQDLPIKMYYVLIKFDIPSILAIFFVLSLFFYSFRFIIELAYVYYPEYSIQMYITSTRKKIFKIEPVQKILIGISLLIILFMLFITYLAVSYQIYILGAHWSSHITEYLWNPYWINVNSTDLPILSQDHILGTNWRGQDIFSRVVFSLSFITLILFFALPVRLSIGFIFSKISNRYNFDISIIIDQFHNMPVILLIPYIAIPLGYVGNLDNPIVPSINYGVYSSLFFWCYTYQSKFIDLGNQFYQFMYSVITVLYSIIVEFFIIGIYIFIRLNLDWYNLLKSIFVSEMYNKFWVVGCIFIAITMVFGYNQNKIVLS